MRKRRQQQAPDRQVLPDRPLTRLMRFVRVTDDHWLWLGPKHAGDGRGRFRMNGQEVRADRAVWQLFHGELAGNLRNVCGESACVCPEPEHRRPA